MAVRKKGSRRIIVDGVAYLWRFPRRPARGAWDGTAGFTVTVQRADRAGSVLALAVRSQHPAVAAVWGSPAHSLRPSQVAAAIRRALAAGWQPGERGADWRMPLQPADTGESAAADRPPP